MHNNSIKFAKRALFPSIFAHLKEKEITIIIGPRQVGKTTLLAQLRDKLLQNNVREQDIITLNLDIISDREYVRDQKTFISFLKERIRTTRLTVFIDEAQRVEDAGIFFKGAYDANLNVKYVLTGSSVLELKAKTTEPLTGRKRMFYLYPFSFQEYLQLASPSLAQIVSLDTISGPTRTLLNDHFLHFITWGGYPRIVTETLAQEKIALLKEIYSSYIEKDVSGFLNIKNERAFSKLVTALAGQIGQLVNVNELSALLGVERKTVEHYLDILEKTCVTGTVPPYFTNTRKELIKMPKIFFIDTGLRNVALQAFGAYESRPDKGSLLENGVYSELQKYTDQPIHFWRTREKSEIDFIIRPKHYPLPIEVKSTALKEGAIPKNFIGFIQRYKPTHAVVVNRGFRGDVAYEGSTIHFIHPYETPRLLPALTSNQ